MKEKILAALKTRFGNMGYGDAWFDGIATDWATTITDEAEIGTRIAIMEPSAKIGQAHRDAALNKQREELTKPKGTDPKPNDPTPEPKKQEEGKKNDDDAPAWAKALIEQNQKLNEKIAAIESGKVAETRTSKFAAALKDMPEGKLKDRLAKDFERLKSVLSDDEFEAHLTETTDFVKESVQEQANSNLRGMAKPFSSSGQPSKEASKEEVDAVMNLM